MNRGTCGLCGDQIVGLRDLGVRRVEGITTEPTKPASGIHDAIAVTLTAMGVFAVTVVGALVVGSWGLLLGPVTLAFGYHKQFWRPKLEQRLHALPAPLPRPTSTQVVTGVIQRHEADLGGRGLVQTIVGISHIAYDSQGMFVRAVEHVPFWIVAGERRMLVDGAQWIESLAARRLSPEAGERELATLQLPLAAKARRALVIHRSIIEEGATVEVSGGTLVNELIGGVAYREIPVEVLRGEAGAPLFVKRLA